MDSDAPVATAAVRAIRSGDITALERLLAENPGLASEAIYGSRTPLHVAADWPGYFPNGPAVVSILIGAEPSRELRLRRGRAVQ
jgi:hypothetical protein